VSTIEELLGRKSSGCGLEIENTAVGDRRSDYEQRLYPQKLALSSPTSGGRSVGIVRSRLASGCATRHAAYSSEPSQPLGSRQLPGTVND
jgi:hypothetical protein